ncbi:MULTISPECIES: hypothetical protein [Xanthomonas translucens group]|uniref:Uncharacterized protein n=1 Tax=Xanthomonas cerealis pv. cerealis TaxID=152263 RepID=A0A514EBL0_9XANT|nr:hypothetical protein [Xanthomonas translucens]QDI03417.1 hypothetical protein E4A48_06680 [Xanthomonas translucens pv. cerealis]UKE45613.1 hypothetical protein KHA79_10370 [Xanthomonas translucens pv. cerealis]
MTSGKTVRRASRGPLGDRALRGVPTEPEAGFAGEIESIEDERWQSQWLSAADFVRLGSLPDMTPLSFWRILDANEAVHKAGVSILNINGVLNLIGWVRSNDGQLAPRPSTEMFFVLG